jgi:hypothetical protein
MRARFFSAAIAAALLAGCAGASSGYSGVSPAMPATHDGLISFASDGPQLQTLDVPLSEFPMAIGTLVTGIRGKFISGFENNLNGSQIGFIYDRNAGTWTKLKKPGATATSPYGPTLTSTGYRVVGSYENQGETGTQGFIYDSTTKKYQTVDAPTNLCAPKACNFTIFHSNFGKTDFQAVGNYDAVKSTSTSGTSDTYPQSGHAFIYDSKAGTFTTLQIAGAISSTAYGIWVDGKTTAIAGGYNDKKGTHAYVRSLDGSKMLSYDWPKSAITHFEGITGAGGAGNYNVIGDYTDAKNKQLVYGFFLPIRNWTAGTATVIGPVSANSVYQNTVIGVYVGAGLQNGYITKIAP